MKELHKRFILSNVVGTFLHEMGHMLIKDYEIPIFGKEEDACDEFQNYYLLVNEEHKKYYNDFNYYRKFFHDILMDNADYYFYCHKLKYDIHDNPYGNHPYTLARFFHAISIMYDCDNMYFNSYFKKRDIDFELIKAAELKYYKIQKNWEEIKLLGDKKKYKGKFKVTFKDSKKFNKYKELIEDSNILSHNLFMNNFYFPLKDDVNIIFDEDDDNQVLAYCSHHERKIFISYDYIDLFDELYSKNN